MSGPGQFIIGSEVLCSDGGHGELRRVVVDPVARTLTHLVVEPRHRPGSDRLVPVDLVVSATNEIRLRCTTAEFGALDSADETQFLPGAPGYPGYDEAQLLSWPYFNLGGGVSGIGLGRRRGPQLTVHDRVPLGEVEFRRGEHVHATDAMIGRVHGLVIEPSDHQVTHVLLGEGHLWGKRMVAIPISAVARVDDGVWLNISKDEVRDLPVVDLAKQE